MKESITGLFQHLCNNEDYSVIYLTKLTLSFMKLPMATSIKEHDGKLNQNQKAH